APGFAAVAEGVLLGWSELAEGAVAAFGNEDRVPTEAVAAAGGEDQGAGGGALGDQGALRIAVVEGGAGHGARVAEGEADAGERLGAGRRSSRRLGPTPPARGPG